MPQASSAHDTFYDFCGADAGVGPHGAVADVGSRDPALAAHDGGLRRPHVPASQRKGKSTYVKFHWKPVLGMHSLVWDEAQKIAGKDPIFIAAICGKRSKAARFRMGTRRAALRRSRSRRVSFDILDPTKLIPEELVPVQRIGKMTLDRNPDSFFAETEQVAFCTIPRRAGHRLHQRPAAAGPQFLVSGYAALAPRRSELQPDPDQSAAVPVPQQSARRACTRCRSQRRPTSYDPNSVGGNFPKESTAGFREFSRADRRRQAARAGRFVQGSLLASQAVLQQSVGSREAAYHQRVLVRTCQGRTRGAPAIRERLSRSGDALHFIAEAYKHAKPIAATGEGRELIERAGVTDGAGVLTGDGGGDVTAGLIEALGRHRVWERDAAAQLIPA
jgi:hypothetical protein